MAQLEGVFTDERAALEAVEKLRAMDVPDGDIVLSREGKGNDARFVLTAQVPEGQFSAAQAVVNAALRSPSAIPSGSAGVAGGAAPAYAPREDHSEEVGGGVVGAIAGGLAGAAVAGPVGAVAGAPVGAVSGVRAADAVADPGEDSVIYSGRGRTGTAGDVLGTRTNEGATADPDVAAMAGPGVIGSGALGGPAALTARAAAIGIGRDRLGDELDSEEPDNEGDTINSVSPR